jgi:CubicO group peptidase (beta-lactamase class C family)
MLNRRFFLLLPLGALVYAQATTERLDAQARAYATLGQFSGSVAVAQDGRLLLSKGYGMANLEWGIPNTPETKFRLGSITKQFTAVAVLMLEQQGKLKVTDGVCQYLEPCPEAWKALTIHHLLTHTAGLPNFTGFPEYSKTMMVASPPSETVKRFADKPLEFEPGSRMKYSNSGYVLLGLIVEKAAKQSYAAYLEENVFGPLGMRDTGYDMAAEVLARRASGYERRGSKMENASWIDMTIPHGAGALYSTTLDLVKWDAALDAGKLLTPENFKRMYTPVKNNYAYGWNVVERDGVRTIMHSGGINGFATMILRVPERKLVVVTLSNALPSQAGKLGNDLLKLALGQSVEVPKEPATVRVPVDVLRQYVGEYVLRPDFILTVTLDGETLSMQGTGQRNVALQAKSQTTFFPGDFEAEVRFERDAAGKVTSLVLNQGGREQAATRR